MILYSFGHLSSIFAWKHDIEPAILGEYVGYKVESTAKGDWGMCTGN